MKRSYTWALAAMALGAGFFVGLFADSDDVAAAAIPSAKDRPVRSQQKPVQLTLWHYWGNERQPMVERMIDQFEKTYPWIRVTALVKNATAMRNEFTTAVVGGSPPDLIMIRRYEVPSFAYEGMLLPIDTYLSERKLNPFQHFYPSEMSGFVIDGKTYSMPGPTGGATTYLIAYNRDLFEEAGLPDRSPETWAEMESFAEKLNRWDANRGWTQLGIASNAVAYLPALYSNAGRYISDDGRTLYLNSAASIETLQWMARLAQGVNRGLDAERQFVVNIGNPQNGAFWAGYQAMWWANVSVFNNQPIFAPDMRMGIGLMPRNGRNAKAGNHGVVMEGWGYAIPANIPAERQYAAYLLLEWLTAEPEAAGWFMLEQRRPSPIRGLNANPAYRKLNDQWDVVIRALESDVSIPITPVHSEILRSVIVKMATDVMAGTESPRVAVEKAQQQAQQILNTYWKDKATR